MKDIFVSYRRSDSQSIVGRILDRLEAEFGDERVFRDIESIKYGQDFGDVIDQALAQCQVFLVIIGDDWVTVTNEAGERRLENSGDWVRREVANALNNEILVIPVLVENAELPSANQLPDDLKPIASRNAAKVRDDPDFDIDIERLCTAIKNVVADKASVSPTVNWKPVSFLVAAISLIALVVFASGLHPWTASDPKDAVTNRPRAELAISLYRASDDRKIDQLGATTIVSATSNINTSTLDELTDWIVTTIGLRQTGPTITVRVHVPADWKSGVDPTVSSEPNIGRVNYCPCDGSKTLAFRRNL